VLLTEYLYLLCCHKNHDNVFPSEPSPGRDCTFGCGHLILAFLLSCIFVVIAALCRLFVSTVATVEL